MNKKVLKSSILEYNSDSRKDTDEKRNSLHAMIPVLKGKKDKNIFQKNKKTFCCRNKSMY